MNKAELVQIIHEKVDSSFTKAQALAAVNAVLEGIKLGVKEEDSVQLIGFGTFKSVTRQARNGVNPKTKKKIKIPASKSVKFSPGKAFKEIL